MRKLRKGEKEKERTLSVIENKPYLMEDVERSKFLIMLDAIRLTTSPLHREEGARNRMPSHNPGTHHIRTLPNEAILAVSSLNAYLTHSPK